MNASRTWKTTTITILSALAGVLLLASAAEAASRVCTLTAKYQYRACRYERIDDYYETVAFCVNDPEESQDCKAEARAEKKQAALDCREQYYARKDLCKEIGEAPHDPDLDPAGFQDPRNPTTTNPHFPLDVGNQWVYEEDGERIAIEILDETKRIAGLDCIVYRDIVTSDELLVEDTDDWFAIRTNGDIVYCGEEVKDYEYTEGDDPEAPELVSIDGRFKVGVDLAKAGTAFPGTPVVGQSYRQEWDPGNAEDVGKVLSVSYGYGQDPELDEFVPQALAELMCPENDCVVIRDTSTLEPDAFERKYYARGVGKFLEVKPDEGEFVPLIECNVDPKCSGLPVEIEEDEGEEESEESHDGDLAPM